MSLKQEFGKICGSMGIRHEFNGNVSRIDAKMGPDLNPAQENTISIDNGFDFDGPGGMA